MRQVMLLLKCARFYNTTTLPCLLIAVAAPHVIGHMSLAGTAIVRLEDAGLNQG